LPGGGREFFPSGRPVIARGLRFDANPGLGLATRPDRRDAWSGMNKRLRKFAIVAVVLGVLVYFGLSFFLGFVVKTAINRIAPKITQTTVVLSGARISPVSGSGVLRSLYVANPSGWSSGRAFYLGRIYVSMKPFSIFGDHIIIDEIDIDQPEFAYETRLFSSNINDLIHNIGEYKGGSTAGAGDTTKDGHAIKFEVRHLRLTHGKVTLGVGAAALPLPLPTIELHNLGTGEGGITSGQLALAVMKSVSGEIVGATTHAAGKIGSTAGAAATEGVKKAGEGLKKLLGGGK
jgi:hypothetical protein